jgi:hypothetical protein
MKKLIFLALAAFALVATAQVNKIDIPLPGCNPCSWVR